MSNAISSLKDTCLLNDQVAIPWVGLGTYQSPQGDSTYKTVLYAIEQGYRHIDTAAIYGNEADVGRAVRDCGLKREEIFVTTKLWNDDQGYESAKAALNKSLATLGLDYVDLYLIHWPLPGKRLDSWKALTELKQAGYARSVGVSNFTVKHLSELFEHSDVRPSINQVEFSPFLYQQNLLEFCTKHSIYLQAYSPLTKGRKLTDPRLETIAAKHQVTAAQVMLKWALDLKVIVLPKSNSENRIVQNSQLFGFTLDENDHKVLASMNEDYRTSWDPTTLGG